MRVIHIVKMIYNVSHHYNTPERVASLLVKITNQVIRTCKRYITQGGRKTIWNQDRIEVEEKLMQCIKLNQDYKDAYSKVKNRKVGKEIREFSFSEKYIFGRFDSFCTRLRNLLSMFKKMSLYCGLFQNFTYYTQFHNAFYQFSLILDKIEQMSSQNHFKLMPS